MTQSSMRQPNQLGIDESVTRSAMELALKHAGSAVPGSSSEYFSVLLARASRAAADGNYGIAAALTIRSLDIELVCFGSSTILSDHNPLGHAEANAIYSFHSLWTNRAHESSTEIMRWENTVHVAQSDEPYFIRRRAAGTYGRSDGRAEATIYTSLEPCPMCTVAIVNAGVQRVVIATKDDLAGALLPEHLPRLGPFWTGLIAQREILVEVAKSGDDASGLMVPDAILERLSSLFRSSRESLDDWIGAGGLMEDVELRAISRIASWRSVSIEGRGAGAPHWG